MSKVPRKVDSAEYFEAMAAHYDAFIGTCIQFEIPRHITLTMSEMIIHLRRAAQQLRKKGKR